MRNWLIFTRFSRGWVRPGRQKVNFGDLLE